MTAGLGKGLITKIVDELRHLEGIKAGIATHRLLQYRASCNSCKITGIPLGKRTTDHSLSIRPQFHIW
jgi:hypothetical protein